MFGGSGKSGRGGRGGGGGGKRNLHSNFHSTSINRPSGGRPSVAGSSAPRNSRSTSTTGVAPVAAPSVAAEETFSLVTGNPLDFAMIIRLAPDLVDEIKRVEAQGTSARIKFDANANNSSGNVIDVGGKEFRFTWSREMGDLCDIYEERRSGEDGNGLLVESGCAWRKLNVQRVLDESTKNHVKMRSEEAERKSKSRKAIILDHGNPSMKSQMKALAAAEANPWKMPFKQKKEPPYKKRKAEPPPGPPKSAQKHGFSLTTPSRGRTSASPLPSTPEQPHASASPFGPGSLCKGHASVEDNMPTQATNKEKALSSEKGTPNRVNTTAVLDKAGRKGNLGAKPTDLRSTLISLLMDNPKGMSLKALEKSVGENFPNSGRQIEPIIKKIATFQAPGRYFLKSGTELESLKKPLSESGSSENNQQQTPGPGDNRDDVRDPEQSVSMKTHITENDVQTHSNSEPGEVTVVEKGNVPLHSPDPYAEKKVSENINGPVATSSGSDSESDSESDSTDSGSDSGSHSRGRSKSRSPVGSGSGSSSDSESDASSNSKEGSDVEVDIMTSDDDKELKGKLQAPEPESSTSPLRPDGLLVHDLSNEKENFYASEAVENMKNSPGYAQVTETVSFGDPISNKEGEMHPQLTKPSADWSLPQERQMHTGHLQGEREKTAKDGFKHDRYQRKSEGKSKRRSEGKHFDDNAERSKKVKAGVTEAPMSEDSNLLLSRSPGKSSPGRPNEGSYRGLNTQITEKAAKDRTDFGLHRAYNQLHPSKALSDSLQSGPRPVDLSARTKAPANDRPGKYAENLGVGVKSTERSFQTPEGFPMQKDKVYREIHSEDGYNNERRPPRNPREGVADKNSTPADSHYKKRGEFAGTFNEVGSVSNSQMGYPPKDNSRSDMDRSPIINGRGSILRREPSDLELGELRDPLPEETPGIKKQFDRKGSFKQSENKLSSSDYWNPDLSKVKPAARTGMDSVRPFSPHLNVGVRSNPDGSSKKKKSPESYGEDSTKSRYRVVQPQTSQLPRVEEAEVGSQINKLADVNIKSGQIEAVASQGIGLEGYGDTHRKVPKVTSQPLDTVQGRVAHSTRESKRRKTNTSAEFNDKCEEPPLMDIRDGEKKKRGSFTDDSSFIYSKYEKDKPELKGPIKDHSQYMEYVQEYREKYDSYTSINKILESERNEFIKFGRDLESAKGKDMNRYNSILEQLRESYRQRGMRHKRLKKVFVVLHEELKSLKETIREYASSYAKD